MNGYGHSVNEPESSSIGVQRRARIIGGGVVLLAVITVVWISLANRRASDTSRSAVSVKIVNIKPGAALPPDIEVVVNSRGVHLKGKDPSQLRFEFQMDSGKLDIRAHTADAQRPTRSGSGGATLTRYSATAVPRIRYRNLPTGTHTLVVRLIDQRGHIVPRVRDSVSFTVRAPKLTIPASRASNKRGEGFIYPEPGARVERDFSARITVPAGFDMQPPASGSTTPLPRRYIEWSLDQGAFDVPAHSSATGLLGSVQRSATTSSSISYRDIPPGRHVLTARCVDARKPSAAQTFVLEFTVAD